MPYIKQGDRKKLDSIIRKAVNIFEESEFSPNYGELNYFISKIVWELFKEDYCYTNGNNLMGTLECVKHEFYRRQLAVLEDQKISDNGDI